MAVPGLLTPSVPPNFNGGSFAPPRYKPPANPLHNFDPIHEYDLYKTMLPKDASHPSISHHSTVLKTPACLLACTKWVMDVYECKIVEGSGAPSGNAYPGPNQGMAGNSEPISLDNSFSSGGGTTGYNMESSSSCP